MTAEGKTIDGFSVRSASDSKLVSRSKANKIPSNNATKKVRVVSQNDPLVRRKKKQISKSVSTDTKTTKKRRVSKPKTAEVFTSEPKAFNITVEPSQDENAYLEEESVNDSRVSRIDNNSFDEVLNTPRANDDFLAPVKSFDVVSGSDSVSEGEISDVDDEEIKDMKKQKKELRESEKRAKRE